MQPPPVPPPGGRDAKHVQLLAVFHFVVAGLDMLKRRRRTLSMVVAGFNCLSLPVGTVLGIFTFIVLSRDSVRALYDTKKPDTTTAP